MTHRAADSEEFENLFRRYYPAVVAYTRRRVAREAVDDAVAETFTVAWRRLDRVPSEPLPWLLGVARNVIGTQQRAARRQESLASRLQSDVRPWEERDVAGSIEIEGPSAAILDELYQLSPSDREAITLIAWDELTPAEAAAALGQSPVTFRVHLHRAKRRLIKRLAARGVTEAPSKGATCKIREEIIQ
jgi:RNA polymerase sigma-70 factor (ECF subfamily)